MHPHTRQDLSTLMLSLSKAFPLQKVLNMCVRRGLYLWSIFCLITLIHLHCGCPSIDSLVCWKPTLLNLQRLNTCIYFIPFSFAAHTLFMYVSACLRGIWTHFTQLTCSDTMLVWVSNCSSVEHDATVKHAFPFSLSTTFSLCIFFLSSLLHSGTLSSLIFRHFPLLVFPLILCLFPIFPRTGFAASSAGRILFRCRIKILGKSCPSGGIKAGRFVSFGGEWHRFLHWRWSRRDASN